MKQLHARLEFQQLFIKSETQKVMNQQIYDIFVNRVQSLQQDGFRIRLAATYITDCIPEWMNEEMSLSCRRNESLDKLPDSYFYFKHNLGLSSTVVIPMDVQSQWMSNPNEGKTEKQTTVGY